MPAPMVWTPQEVLARVGDVILFRKRVEDDQPWGRLIADLNGDVPDSERATIAGNERREAFAHLKEHGVFPGYVGDVWWMPFSEAGQRVAFSGAIDYAYYRRIMSPDGFMILSNRKTGDPFRQGEVRLGCYLGNDQPGVSVKVFANQARELRLALLQLFPATAEPGE